MKNIILWVTWFIVAEIIIFAIQFIVRKKQFKPYIYAIIGVVKIIVGIALGVLVMAGPIVLRAVQPLMSALYVALLGDGVSDIIFSIFSKKIARKRLLTRKIVGLILGITLFAYGTVNMQIVKPEYINFSSQKLNNEYTFVFASDIHIGSAQPKSVYEKSAKDMLAEDVDFIVLGGDITDDYTTKEQMEEYFALYKNAEMPIYYIFGNHDKQDNAEYANGRQFTVDELKYALNSNGITILEDDFVSIGDDLIIFGRTDYGEKENRTDINVSSIDSYFIVFDHQPFDVEGMKTINPDLQVSGHTHAGQFFPLNFFNDAFIADSCGEYHYDDVTLFVSAGASGWRVPFRSDHHCRYEVITISPSK